MLRVEKGDYISYSYKIYISDTLDIMYRIPRGAIVSISRLGSGQCYIYIGPTDIKTCPSA